MIPDNHLRGIASTAIYQYGALQDEWEFAMLLTMVQQMKPKTIVEIGSYTGGSLYAWRKALPDARVIGVTLGDNVDFEAHGASMIFGDSTHPETITKLYDATRRQADFVFVDGGHDEATARADVNTAMSLAFQAQGAVGIHDINLLHRYPELYGPRMVWSEISQQRPSIEVSNIVSEDPGFGIFWMR